MDDAVQEAVTHIEDALAPHGYYLHPPDEQSKLKLGFTELGLFALGLLVWAGTEYLKSFLSEKGKIDANRIFGSQQQKEEELKAMLEELKEEVQQLKKRSDELDQITAIGISKQSLILTLQEIGLTERASIKICNDVCQPLSDETRQLFKTWQS
jgi:DNA-binding XRE family transcriptional regulator